VALDIARKIHSTEQEPYARIVLIVAVLSILITAPVGATFITVLGPRLLDKEPTSTPESSNQNNGSGSSAH
jgi:NhaP-type Na+/H+ or K+/H+ antiporter